MTYLVHLVVQMRVYPFSFLFLSFAISFLCPSKSRLSAVICGDNDWVKATCNTSFGQCVTGLRVGDDLLDILLIIPCNGFVNGIDRFLVCIEPSFVVDEGNLIRVIDGFFLFPIVVNILFLLFINSVDVLLIRKLGHLMG